MYKGANLIEYAYMSSNSLDQVALSTHMSKVMQRVFSDYHFVVRFIAANKTIKHFDDTHTRIVQNRIYSAVYTGSAQVFRLVEKTDRGRLYDVFGVGFLQACEFGAYDVVNYILHNAATHDSDHECCPKCKCNQRAKPRFGSLLTPDLLNEGISIAGFHKNASLVAIMVEFAISHSDAHDVSFSGKDAFNTVMTGSKYLGIKNAIKTTLLDKNLSINDVIKASGGSGRGASSTISASISGKVLSINKSDIKRYIFAAACAGDMDTIEVLHEYDEDYNFVMLGASTSGDIDLVKHALRCAQHDKEELDFDRAITFAAGYGRGEMVKLLASKHDVTEEHFIKACSGGSVFAARIIFRKVKCYTKLNEGVLLAGHNGHIKMIEYILELAEEYAEHGNKLDHNLLDEALFGACTSGNVPVVEYLLHRGVRNYKMGLAAATKSKCEELITLMNMLL